mmetsp:Transcript_15455/g.17692  ORF Transcript_15455/g.17692 Transcript_15455/m.17692 type:complete len:913 (-) Transcript_15455:149-2887(-)
MIEILDAPVPYLIGLSSEYFKMVDVRHRPKDTILVDLDRDVIHIGDAPLPEIPERDAQKLNMSLEAAGGSVFLIPNSGIKGCIMRGSQLVPNEDRPRYAKMTTMDVLEMQPLGRAEVFSITDLAYGRFDDETERINGFGSVDGQFTSTEEAITTNEKKKERHFTVSPMKRPNFMRYKKDILSSAMSQGHLLDMAEPEGFSTTDIRKAFLRFTVATFACYQDSLLSNSDCHLLDKQEKFVDPVGSYGEGPIPFLKNILKTQLFMRFLEERRENPDIPEIRFFDESILAKRNRSKKATLVNGGKKPLPFLNDKTTWRVTQIFVPPPPNNLGLPDTEDSRSYRYGTFPVLDTARFGRIRPPATWRQHTNLDSVRPKYTISDLKMKRTRNKIVKNVLDAPNMIAATARRTARNLESTLSALSIIPIAICEDNMFKKTAGGGEEKVPSSQRTVNTLSTADIIMMDARRKQAILLDVLIQIQAISRGVLARLHYSTIKGKVLNTRKDQTQHELESIENIRRELVDTHRKLRICKAIVIQSFVRMYLAQKMADRRLKAIIEIQRNQRASIARQKWRTIKHSVIVIAKNIRARRAQIIFHELKRLVTIIQAIVRGMQVRIGIKSLIEKKLLFYNSQIFLLWECLHVSLIFRTKLWSEISGGHRFIRLRLAESELIRLWEIAGFPDCLTDAEGEDEITRLSDVSGIGNEVYCRSKQCVDWINKCGSILSKSSTENAYRIVETERLQIYVRLNSSVSVSEKDTLTMYHSFDILPDKKLKKVILSKRIWTKLDESDRSASFMKIIFPELSNSLCINFQTPSSKSQRRFPKARKTPLLPIYHPLWDKVSIEGNTKRHVKEVAMLFITRIPLLMIKLDVIDKKRNFKFDSFLEVAMEVYDFKSFEQARCFVIMHYLNNSCSGKLV